MALLQVRAKLAIHEGKLEAFKSIAKTCMDTVRAKDKSTLQYDWYLNADESICHVFEQYGDSNGVLEHVGNLGETLGKLLAISDLSLEIYGNPSDDLKAALEGMDTQYYSTLQRL